MKPGTLLRTIVHLTPRQVVYQGLRRLRGPARRPLSPTREGLHGVAVALPPPSAEGDIEPRGVRLLGRRPLDPCVDGWEPDADPLYVYTLHYHGWLSRLPLARARAQVEHWIAHHQEGVGWEPYPTAMRTLHWLGWLGQHEAHLDATARRRIFGSLAAQLEHLRTHVEHHLGGNHVWTDLAALCSAGLSLSGPLADALALNLPAFADLVDAQLGPDGVHRERTPTYHCLLAEQLAGVVHLAPAAASASVVPLAAARPSTSRAAARAAARLRPPAPDASSRSAPGALSRSAPGALSRSAPDALSRSAPAALSRSAPDALSRSAPDALSRSAPDAPSRSAPAAPSRSAARSASAALPRPTPAARLDAALARMLAALPAFTHPDGDVALWNDSQLAAPVTPRGLAKRLARPDSELHPRSADAPHAGFFRRSFGPWTLLWNSGGIGLAHQPGHIHADGLAFELSLHDERLIVDAGVGTYDPGFARDYARSTRAHSTVTIGDTDRDQHELWASHRIGGRARTTDLSFGPDHLEARLRGYRGAATHYRRLHWDGRRLTCEDRVEPETAATTRLFFPESCALLLRGSVWHGRTAGGRRFRLVAPAGTPWVCSPAHGWTAMNHPAPRRCLAAPIGPGGLTFQLIADP